MIQRLVTVIGWAILAFIAYATLCPIGLRPEFSDAHFEHFGAFAVWGLIFAVAYPRHLGLVVLIVVGSALALELMQLLTPDRHGRIIDASIKAAGGLLGVGIGRLVYAVIRARRIQTGLRCSNTSITASTRMALAPKMSSRVSRSSIAASYAHSFRR